MIVIVFAGIMLIMSLWALFCVPCTSEESQCTGYKLLKQMVKEDITPAGINEALRYSVCPTTEELLSPVPLKYLKFLHVNLRLVIIKHWEHIKKLEL